MIYKRGRKGTYWYRFMFQGRLVRESTHQTNDKGCAPDGGRSSFIDGEAEARAG